jgi:peptide/nickel transport system substrate-binding protein
VASLGIASIGASASAATKSQSYDKNGILKRPTDLSLNGGLSFDPANMAVGDYTVSIPVTASWLKRNLNGTYSPELASKVDAPDPQTIVVTLRPNLKFSNGETLDAQAAVNSITRTAAAKAPGLRVAEMGLVSGITVNSPTQFTIKLSTPSVGQYYPLLADAETAPIAPATIAANTKTSKTAIGAGPMKIDSYTPGSSVKMSKNDNYWNAKSVKLAGAEIVNVATGPGNAATALRSGTVDVIPALPFADKQSLAAPIKVFTVEQNAPYWLNMCRKAGTPLANPKVVQAINYAIDRNDLNKRFYNGQSSPAWSLFPSDDKVFGNPATNNAYPYNVAKAKKLLADAGFPNGLELTQVTTAGDDANTIDQILQAQLAKAGIKLNLKVTNNVVTDWYLNPTGDMNTVPMIREGVGRLTRLVTSTAFANVCKVPFPEADQAATQLSGLAVDDPAASKIWKQVDKAFTDMPDGAPLVWSLNNTAYGPKVGCLAWQLDGILRVAPDYSKICIKK